MKQRIKVTCGVPSHRPTTEADRDRRIWKLKLEHPEWSFGEIAEQCRKEFPNAHINYRVAEAAYKRYVTRWEERFTRLEKIYVISDEPPDPWAHDAFYEEYYSDEYYSRISDLAPLTARVYTLTRRSATISSPGRERRLRRHRSSPLLAPHGG